MNKVQLVGRLTRDPEIRYSQGENATATARFSVAVNRRFKNAEGNYQFFEVLRFHYFNKRTEGENTDYHFRLVVTLKINMEKKVVVCLFRSFFKMGKVEHTPFKCVSFFAHF